MTRARRMSHILAAGMVVAIHAVSVIAQGMATRPIRVLVASSPGGPSEWWPRMRAGSKRTELKVFTRVEGGYHHCQVDNISIGSAYMWDWAADVLQAGR